MLGSTSSRKIPVLDGVRGVAIAMVLLYHFGSLDQRLIAHTNWPFRSLLSLGWCGVDLFFVLSGYLITGILIDSKGASNYFSSFYMRRVLRICPLYYGLLVGWFLILPAFVDLYRHTLSPLTTFGRDQQVWFWLYLSNVGQVLDHDVGALSHTWSLAIEEQFYLVWPLIVLMTTTSRALARTAIVLAGVAVLLRCAVVILHVTPEAPYRLMFMRMDALTLGAFVAVSVRDIKSAHVAGVASRRALIACSLILLAVFATSNGLERYDPVTETIGFLALAVFFAAAIGAMVLRAGQDSWWEKVLTSRPLRSLGKYSYGIYVFHWPLRQQLLYALTKSPRLAGISETPYFTIEFLLIGSSMSYMIAWVSWNLYEQRFLRLKDYFAPKLRENTAAPAMPAPAALTGS